MRKIEFLENEFWWGDSVTNSIEMPIDCHKEYEVENVVGGDFPSEQAAPFFVSNKGRVLWGGNSFSIKFVNGIIEVSDDVKIENGGCSLHDAHMHCSSVFYKTSGKFPNEKFFVGPQYNTWIELKYNQNEEAIINYAQSIINNGFPPGVLMIDEGWAEDYGCYDFYPGRFKNPVKMIEKLHEMGFAVMLWITPNISPDSSAYRELRDTDFLIHSEDGEVAIRKWWNGYSCVLDLSNPGAREWYNSKLQQCINKYNIDGFKFDAGDQYFYRDTDNTYIKQTAQLHMREFDNFALEYDFNEFRAVYGMSGKTIVCRLQDKTHSWNDEGIKKLCPSIILQGLLGYFYGCPDMVGGGEVTSFSENSEFEEELYVRWLQASVLCPMVQFSIAPWRVLSKENLNIIKENIKIREKYTPYILELAKNAAESAEPIVRHMEYQFPNEGFESIADQFMLGDKILVAPVLEKGAVKRKVKLPQGIWVDDMEVEYVGGQTIEVDAPIVRLPYFRRVE